MNIIIFGATGSVGRLMVEQAVRQGHQVTAFSRSADPVDLRGTGAWTVQGDVRDPEAVAKAIEGNDAVICALGDGRTGDIRAAGTASIIAGMKVAGVKRLICQSTLGAGDSKGNLNFFWKHVMFGFFLKTAYADHQKQEALVRASGLDWTLVRPGGFTDGPETGDYRHGFSSTVRNLKLRISRADVARFMLSQLTDGTYLHRAAGLLLRHRLAWQ